MIFTPYKIIISIHILKKTKSKSTLVRLKVTFLGDSILGISYNPFKVLKFGIPESKYIKNHSDLIVFNEMRSRIFNEHNSSVASQTVFFCLEVSQEISQVLILLNQVVLFNVPTFLFVNSMFPAIVDLSDYKRQFLIIDKNMYSSEYTNKNTKEFAAYQKRMKRVYHMNFFYTHPGITHETKSVGFLNMIRRIFISNNSYYITFCHCIAQKRYEISKRNYFFLLKSFETIYLDSTIFDLSVEGFLDELIDIFSFKTHLVLLVETHINYNFLNKVVLQLLERIPISYLGIVFLIIRLDGTVSCYYYNEIEDHKNKFQMVDCLTQHQIQEFRIRYSSVLLCDQELYKSARLNTILNYWQPEMFRVLGVRANNKYKLKELPDYFQDYHYKILFFTKKIDLQKETRTHFYNHTFYKTFPNQNKLLSLSENCESSCFTIVGDISNSDFAVGYSSKNMFDLLPLKELPLNNDKIVSFYDYSQMDVEDNKNLIKQNYKSWILIKINENFKTEFLTSKAEIFNLLLYYKQKNHLLNQEYRLATNIEVTFMQFVIKKVELPTVLSEIIKKTDNRSYISQIYKTRLDLIKRDPNKKYDPEDIKDFMEMFKCDERMAKVHIDLMENLLKEKEIPVPPYPVKKLVK